MYNSSRTILVQEVNNHDWFFYKLSGQSLNNGSIFSIQNNIFICEIYTGFPMPMMLLHLQDYVISISCNMCACATCLPVDSCACCTVHLTDVARQKKSIICQQVQHNFEQYITRLKKKTRSTRKKHNYFSIKCAKSTEIWAYIYWYRSRLRYEFVRGRLFTLFVTHRLCGWLNTSK